MRKKRALKIVFGSMALIVVASVFWRFYDPMPDVAMPVRKVEHPEAYNTLMSEMKSFEPYRTDELNFLTPKFRTKQKVTVARQTVQKRLHTIENVKKALDLPFEAPMLTQVYFPTELLNNAKHIGIVMNGRGILYLIDGDSERAFDWCFACWRFGADVFLIGAFDIQMLVGMSIMGFARASLYECLEKTPPPNPSEFIGYLEEHNEKTPNASALLQRETEEFKSKWLTRMTQPGWLTPPETDDWLTSYEPSFWEKVRVSFIKKRDFMAKGLQRRAEAKRVVSRYYSTKPITFTDLGDVGELSAGMIEGGGIADTLLWFFKDSAANNMLLAYLGLEQYKKVNGRYPGNLNELVPGILKSVPNDPFNNGLPLQYSRTIDSFKLYSLGPDMKDDGGTPIFRVDYGAKNYRAVFSKSTGDIVWGVNKI